MRWPRGTTGAPSTTPSGTTTPMSATASGSAPSEIARADPPATPHDHRSGRDDRGRPGRGGRGGTGPRRPAGDLPGTGQRVERHESLVLRLAGPVGAAGGRSPVG